MGKDHNPTTFLYPEGHPAGCRRRDAEVLKVPLQTCFHVLLLTSGFRSSSQALWRWEGGLFCHKQCARESQQVLGQLKAGRWKPDTLPHGAGSFPAESAKSL